MYHRGNMNAESPGKKDEVHVLVRSYLRVFRPGVSPILGDPAQAAVLNAQMTQPSPHRRDADSLRYPGVFIWSPLDQFPFERACSEKPFFTCPNYGVTDAGGNLRCKGTGNGAPLLTGHSEIIRQCIYDVNDSFVFCTRRLRCPLCGNTWSTTELHNQLPSAIRIAFPLINCPKRVFPKPFVSHFSLRGIWGIYYDSWNFRCLLFNNLMRYRLPTPQSPSSSSSSSSNPFPAFDPQGCPSDDYLRDAFLQVFRLYETFYVNEMAGTDPGDCLGGDHTFKLSANIGFVDPKTRQWLRQFNSVYFVLNQAGQVVGWQLCTTTELDEVRPLLTDIARRWPGRVKTFCTDTCCRQRAILQEIFGPHLKVSLDLWHALHRLSPHIRKKNPHAHDALTELTLCFRNQNPETHKAAGPVLDRAKTKQVTMRAHLTDLMQHVRCVGSQVHHGTSLNENLHSRIGKLMQRSRIAPPLAHALVSVNLLRINRERAPAAPGVPTNTYSCLPNFWLPPPPLAAGLSLETFGVRARAPSATLPLGPDHAMADPEDGGGEDGADTEGQDAPTMLGPYLQSAPAPPLPDTVARLPAVVDLTHSEALPAQLSLGRVGGYVGLVLKDHAPLTPPQLTADESSLFDELLPQLPNKGTKKKKWNIFQDIWGKAVVRKNVENPLAKLFPRTAQFLKGHYATLEGKKKKAEDKAAAALQVGQKLGAVARAAGAPRLHKCSRCGLPKKDQCICLFAEEQPCRGTPWESWLKIFPNFFFPKNFIKTLED
ncbi:hypothetical protein PAPYR_9351 [Paratrimastix pyriformis]|uniref:Transposase n=1 Tax=Paratrimastix pyriformis TaxID=342808 RepID=A0ABQ8U8M5_9EUKA|nr:hypothetical protein PAPYR_9351 [Paratrimastix pyriformis]